MIAVLGATGFVGTRMCERWTLRGSHRFRALVRGPASLARLARFPLPDWRQVDAFDPDSMAKALEGCRVLVHGMVGDEKQIAVSAEVAAEACAKAGVKRLVYISSASVHGQNPAPGTDESSPLRDDQPFAYNNAKVRAEWALRKAPKSLEICILRPGVVYGPRCQWFQQLSSALSRGEAYLVKGGHGICNHIYVDNLIHAVEIAMDHPRAAEGPFYVADSEAMTWAAFYRPIVEGLGYSMDDLHEVGPVGPPAPGLRDKVSRFKGSRTARVLLPRFSRRLKDAVKAGVERYSSRPARSGFLLPEAGAPVADYEMSELHTCATRLPMAKAQSVLSYAPIVAASKGLVRSVEWLLAYSEAQRKEDHGA